MASLTISKLRKSFGSLEVLKGIDLEVADGRVHRACRTFGLRQIDSAGDDRGTRDDLVRRDPHRRPAGQFGRAEGPRHRDGVPVLCALSDHDRAPEHHLRHGVPPRAAPAAGRGGGARGGAAADRAAAATQARPAFRRPAPARRDGPRPGARPQAVSVRRAAFQPRRQVARRDARGDQEDCISASARRRSMSRTTRSRR